MFCLVYFQSIFEKSSILFECGRDGQCVFAEILRTVQIVTYMYLCVCVCAFFVVFLSTFVIFERIGEKMTCRQQINRKTQISGMSIKAYAYIF